MNFSISCKLKKKSIRTINEARRQGQKSSRMNKTRGIKSSYNNLRLFLDTVFFRNRYHQGCDENGCFLTYFWPLFPFYVR